MGASLLALAKSIYYEFPKGRTIRKVKGGGGFSSRRNFFSLSNSLYEFFLGHTMNVS